MTTSDRHNPAAVHSFPIEEAERSVAPWFSLAYHEQLERKEQRLREVLDPSLTSLIEPILPSPRIVGHRNKMEFSFGYDDDERPALGFHQRGKFWRVQDLNRSAFLSDAANDVYAALKQWAMRTGLPFYRQVDNRGFFRYLVIREGKYTGEVLANLVVNPSGYEERVEGLAAELVQLAQRLPALASLWLSFRRSVGDAATGEESRCLAGSRLIHEKLLGLTFLISPSSFFQVNTFGAEVLYEKLRQLVSELAPRRRLVDLYCGSGGMALILSPLFDELIGIDSDVESIGLARENAQLNGINNTRFICSRAKQIHQVLSPPIDVMVVDPPRAGLTPKAARNVLRMAPRHLIYISCNPHSFRENMRLLRRRFQVKHIIPVDLFPHTPHIELIARLDLIAG